MPLELGIDRRLAELGATAGLNDRARLPAAMLRIVIDSRGGPETRACHAINAGLCLSRNPGWHHPG